MPESGAFSTINELAEHEDSAFSCMTRVLRLTLLAPDIVETILEERQGAPVAHGRSLKGFPGSGANSGIAQSTIPCNNAR